MPSPLSFEEFLRRTEAGEDSSSIFGLSSADSTSVLDQPYRPPASPPPTPPSHGPLRTAWDYGSSPVKALFGVTGAIGGLLGKVAAPEAYARAQEELAAGQPTGFDWTKEAQTLPGLGDVAANAMSPEFRSSTAGRILEPVSRIGLNILGDPTTYIGGIGAFSNAAKAAGKLGRAEHALEAAKALGQSDEVVRLSGLLPTLAEEATAALSAESSLGRAVREIGAAGATGQAARSAFTSPTVRGFGRLSATLPFSPVAGLAYGPELAESLYDQGGQSIEAIRAGRYADAAASGTGALLTAGLGAMVAHGTLTELQAADVLTKHVAPRVEPQKPLGGPGSAAEPSPVTFPGPVAAASSSSTSTGEGIPTPASSMDTPPVAAGVPPVETAGVPAATPLTQAESPPVNPVNLSPARDVVQPDLPPPLDPRNPRADSIMFSGGREAEAKAAQSLRDLLAKTEASGVELTKAMVAEAGIATPNQLRKYPLAAIAHRLLGEEGQRQTARWETTHLGFRIKPEAPTAAPVAAVPEAVPPTAPMPMPPPASAASIPFMITRQMEAGLLGQGYTKSQIDSMLPEEAGRILAAPPDPSLVPVEATQPLALATQLTTADVSSPISPISPVRLTLNFPLSRNAEAGLVAASTDPVLSDLTQRLGVTEVRVDPPHTYDLGTEGAVTYGGVVRLNPNAQHPAHTLGHELGHLAWGAMTPEQRIQAERIVAENSDVIAGRYPGNLAEHVEEQWAELIGDQHPEALALATQTSRAAQPLSASTPSNRQIEGPPKTGASSWADVDRRYPNRPDRYLEADDDLHALAAERDVQVSIKDVNGGRHRMPLSVAADLMDNPVFDGYVRQIDVTKNPAGKVEFDNHTSFYLPEMLRSAVQSRPELRGLVLKLMPQLELPPPPASSPVYATRPAPLSDEAVTARAIHYQTALDVGIPLDPGSDPQFRAIDPESDVHPDLVRAIATATGPDFAYTAARVVQDAAQTLGIPNAVYAGDIASPRLGGLNIDGRILVNSHNAWDSASAQLEKAPFADPDSRRLATIDLAAKNFIDDALHEIAHQKAVGHGDDYAVELARVIRDISPIYSDLYRTMGDAFERQATAFDANLPAYREAGERLGVRRGAADAAAAADRALAAAGLEPRPVPGLEPARAESVPGRDAGTDPSLAPTDADQPVASRADALGGVKARLQSERGRADVSGGGGEPAGRVGGGTEVRGGVEPSAAAVPAAAATGGTPPTPTVIRPIPVKPHPRMAAAAAQLEDELTGVKSKSKSTPKVSAHILTPVIDLLRGDSPETQNASLRDKIGAIFIRNLSSLSGGTAADEDAIIAALAKAPPEFKKALRHAGPGEPIDIAWRAEKYLTDSMSDEQKEAVSFALWMKEKAGPRSGIVTWDKITREEKALLKVRTPEEWVRFSKANGISTPAELSLFRTITALGGKETDDAYRFLQAAKNPSSGTPDPATIAAATEALKWARGRRDAALGVLLPATSNAGRMLGLLRSIAHPPTPGEAFDSRFLGSLKALGVKKAETRHQLLSMFNTLAEQGGDWSTLTQLFRESTQPTRFTKFLEFWKAGLLGIPTQIINVTGNLGFLGLRQVESAVGVLADKFFSGLTGAPRRRFVSEISGRFSGMKESLGEALHYLGSDLSDLAHFRTPTLENLERGTFLDPNVNRIGGAIEGKLGEFIRSPFKSLDAFDNFFKHLLRNQEYGAQSSRLAHDQRFRSPGESISHAQARILNEIRMAAEHPLHHTQLFERYGKEAASRGYDNVFLKAKSVADTDTFQKPLSDTMRKIADATVAHPSFQLLFPFFKTPYNILAEGVKRTPLGALWAISEFRKGGVSAEFVDQTVRSSVGSLIMLTAAQSALAGSMTGGGPADPKQLEIKRRTGWQPYSFKIGDQYISYQRLEPFATMLGIAADMAEAWQNKDIQSGSDLLQKGVAAASNNLTNKTFLNGLENLTAILSDPQRKGVSAIRALEASLIPNIIGVVPFAHAARAMDPNFRETSGSIAAPLIAQIPFASQTLPPQLRPTGEIRTRPNSPLERLVSPIARSEVQTGSIAEAASEISRLNFSPSTISPYFLVGKTRVYYTPEERESIAQAQQKGMTAVARLIQSPEYRRLPDFETIGTEGIKTKKQAIQSLLTRYRQPTAQHVERVATRRAKMSETDQ